jgi:hypothetical protein
VCIFCCLVFYFNSSGVTFFYLEFLQNVQTEDLSKGKFGICTAKEIPTKAPSLAGCNSTELKDPRKKMRQGSKESGSKRGGTVVLPIRGISTHLKGNDWLS